MKEKLWKERIAIYNTEEIFNEKCDLNDALTKVCRILPDAWKYPDEAIVRIKYNGNCYISKAIAEDKLENASWVLKENFVTNDWLRGIIEVFYLEDLPLEYDGPYLKSEKDLLKKIAELITHFLNALEEDEIEFKLHHEVKMVIKDKITNMKVFNFIRSSIELLKSDKSIDEILSEICKTIPDASYYSDFAVARIKFGKFKCYSKEVSKRIFNSRKRVIKKSFRTFNNVKGSIELTYTKDFNYKETKHFFESDTALVNNVTDLILSTINQRELNTLFTDNQEKEFQAIKQVTKILKESVNINKALQQITLMLPYMYQHPKDTVVRIKYNEVFFISNHPNFIETQWLQWQTFETIDMKKGIIEVFYMREFPEADEGPFLESERKTLDSIANVISGHLTSVRWKNILNKKKIEEKQEENKITKSVQQSRKLLQQFLNKNSRSRNVYHDLMPFKVKEILLISTLYDAFILENEDRFFEQSMGEVYHLNLSYLPRITGVTSAVEALEALQEKKFDLVIVMVGADKDKSLKMCRMMNEILPDLRINLLLNNNKDILFFQEKKKKEQLFNQIFVWNGDSTIFFAMVKLLEDNENAKNDCEVGFTKVILVVEDSVKYYSRYLPKLYSIIFEQTQQLISDAERDDFLKISRMKTRTKIILATDYEEAIQIFNEYKDHLLAVISDVEFEKNDKIDAQAGFKFVEYVKKNGIAIPIALQSSNTNNKTVADELKTTFINKNSDTLLSDVKDFIMNYLGFGDFIFRDKSGKEIARAKSMREFTSILVSIPEESLRYHAVKNHFSMWLMARGEIHIARKIHPKKVADFSNLSELRYHLLNIINDTQINENKGCLVKFTEADARDETTVISISSGSLGGKGRGLVFINSLIHNLNLKKILPEIKIKTPLTGIIGSNEFDRFITDNNLSDIVDETDYNQVRKRFLKGKLSKKVRIKLKQLLKQWKKPLAVRSSSLFEDSLMQPFSGIFATFLIPNNHKEADVRLKQVSKAVKLVYASIFSPEARNYFSAVNYKIEEEKMAVIIQEVVGNKYDNFYYPHISGTAQSYNYYPIAHMKPEEGFSVAALGLGKYVVEGEKSFRFSQKYPRLELVTPKSLYRNSQVHFYAVDLTKSEIPAKELLKKQEDAGLAKLEIYDAEKHGALKHCASVYNPDSDRVVPGLSANGPRIINFANILKYNYIPLAKTIDSMLDIVKEALDSPVEIEYAVDLNKDKKGLASFYLLQIKPLVGNRQNYNIDFDKIENDSILLYTESSMGNGKLKDIYDIIFVDRNKFDKMKTEQMAAEVEELNKNMVKENRKYVLIGPGRWGTRDKFIGIPIVWPQISNAKVIVEISTESFPLDASLGSHFFHNVTSQNIGYFTVQATSSTDFILWNKLNAAKVIEQKEFFTHVHFTNELDIIMDGKKSIAVICTAEID